MPISSTENKFKQGYTYDDILILPGHSEVLPQDAVLKSQFSKNITLNTPLASAAMDTVTEAKIGRAHV